jgi:hypothetical protein
MSPSQCVQCDCDRRELHNGRRAKVCSRPYDILLTVTATYNYDFLSLVAAI